MTQIVTATIENGLLKPDDSLNLPDGARVQLAIEPLDQARNGRQAAWDDLEQLCQDVPIDSGGQILTRDELHERD